MSTSTISRTVKIDGVEIQLNNGPQPTDDIDPKTWRQVDALAAAIEATPVKNDSTGTALMQRRARSASQSSPWKRISAVAAAILEALAVTGPPASAVFGGYLTQADIDRYRDKADMYRTR